MESVMIEQEESSDLNMDLFISTEIRLTNRRISLLYIVFSVVFKLVERARYTRNSSRNQDGIRLCFPHSHSRIPVWNHRLRRIMYSMDPTLQDNHGSILEGFADKSCVGSTYVR